MNRRSLLALTSAVSAAVLLTTTTFTANAAVKEFVTHAELIKAGRAATTNTYPNSDTVTIADHEQIRYNAGGTYIARFDACAKILTEKGKRAERTQTLWYDVAYGTAMVEKVEVIKPDGTVVSIDLKENCRHMVEPSQMFMNIYNPNSRVVKVSVPDLEIGDMVHMVWAKKEDKARVPGTWSDIEPMEHGAPIIHQVYEVIGPKKRPLKHTVLKNEISNTVTFVKTPGPTSIKYRWEVRKVPRMFAEPGMPGYTALQHLLVSTIPKWQQVSRWYDKLCEPHLKSVTPEMSNTVAELTEDLTDPDEKIKAIFKYVSQKVRYMGITTEDTAPGYEPHDVNITFENKYGVCRDKAALLAAMLRIAGFKAYPGLILAGMPKKDPLVPNPFFNHAITVVENDDGSYTLMDSTDETTKDLLPVYLNNLSYMIANPKGDILRTTPVVPAEENLVNITTEAKYNSKGDLLATSHIVFEGINDAAFRGPFAKMEFDEIRRVFEGIVKKVAPGAKLIDCELEPDDMMDMSAPVSVHLEFTAPDMLVSGRDKTMLPVPWFGPAVGLVGHMIAGNTGLEKRKYPMKTDIACGVKETITLDLGDAVGAKISLPEYSDIDTELLEWKRSVKGDGKTLTGAGEFLLKAVEFSTNQYLVLKELLKEIEYNNRKRLLYAKASPRDMYEEDDEFDTGSDIYAYVPQEDVEITERNVTRDVTDPHSWTTTAKVKKEVVTYAGKKDNAELKIHYNPAWESVKIVRAVVTDPDGEEKELSEDELNLMDAGWVAGAPRYPPGKILVASLPNVDIGSVIEYEVVRKRWKRPFFAMRASFNGFDPVVDQTNRLTVPQSLKLKVREPDSEDIQTTKTVEEEKGKVVYECVAFDQRSVRKEGSLPPWYHFNPTFFASAGDWKTYAAKVGKIFDAAAANQPKCAAKAKELIAGCKNVKEKVIAIRDFVAKNIRSAGPGFTSMPLSAITPADTTLADGYGNSADRAIVLYAMLKSIGLSPEFALSSWASMLEKVRKPLMEYPNTSTFGGVLVRVPVAGALVYLNDTSQYAALGSTPHDGRPCLVLPKGKIETIRATAGMEDKAEVESKVALSENGDVKITMTIRSYGTAYAAEKRFFEELTPEKRKRYFQNAVVRIAQGAKADGDLVTKFDSYPGLEEFSVTVDKYAIRDGDHLYLRAPNILENLLGLRSDARDNPISWSSPTRMESTTLITLPDGFGKVELAPPDVEWEAPEDAGTLTAKTEGPTAKDNVLKIAQTVDLKPAVLPAFDYEDLLEINRKLSHPRMRTVLVSKGAPQPAPQPEDDEDDDEEE